MEKDSYDHGVPCWVDLGTPDLGKASAFYHGLFGWEIREGPPEAGGYSIAEYKGRPVAGFGPQQNPGPPVWATYVKADDVDRIAEKVNANGGKALMPPMSVMDAGRMAFFADPVGAVFGVWQPLEFHGAGLVNESNTFAWNELITTDVAGAKEFYAAVFGWGHETHGPPSGEGAYTEWKVGGNSVGGCMAKPPQMPAQVPPHWGVYFLVDDTDAAVTKITELGGSLIMGPMDIEPGRFAVVSDPTGAVFNIMKLEEKLPG